MKLFHRLPFLVFSLVSVSLLVWSSLYTYAELVQQIPQQTMKNWACNGSIDSENNWQGQQSIMSKVYPFMKLDAQTNTTIARLYDWKAIDNAAWSNSAVESREKAVTYYRTVTELRPIWATGWLSLAKVKSLNQQFDNEVLSAITNTLIYGKNQTGIQSQIIWLTLGMWDSLDDTNQRHVRSLIQDLLNLGKKENFILITAFRFNWVQELKALSSSSDFAKSIHYFEDNPVALEKALNPEGTKKVCHG